MRLRVIFLLLSILFMLASVPVEADRLQDVKAAYESVRGEVLNGWKCQFPASAGMEKVDIDDSSWQTVDVGFNWQGDNNQAWLRKVITIPEKMGGFNTAGNPVVLKLGIDDAGDVYINGVKKVSFRWDEGSIVLTEKAVPGEKIHVAIYAKNYGQPGQLMFARLEPSKASGVVADFGRYVNEIESAYGLAKLLGDKPLKAIETSLVAVDLTAVKSGDSDKLAASLKEAQAILETAGPEFKKLNCHLVSNAHIDMAWLWPWTETVDVCRNTFNSVLNLMDEYPELKYSQSQAHAYMWMEEYEPGIFSKIKRRVKEGRWEIVGGMWVEPDCNLPSGESFVRQVLYGKRYFKEKFGVDVRIGWNPDSFGYAWSLPQIYKKSGIDCFITQKLGWNDTTRFPYNVFRWQGPDGSEIIGHQCFGSYVDNVTDGTILDQQYRAKQGHNINDIMHLYGIGDHGGGPSRDMIDRGKAYENKELFPSIVWSRADQWFNAVKPLQKSFPVYSDELYLQTHRGTFTTQAATKKNNRRSEFAMFCTEQASSLASFFGNAYPKDMVPMWRKVLFNQFHDILPGSSIHRVYEDSAKDYAEVFGYTGKAIDQGLSVVAAQVDTRGEGTPLFVFNPLSWSRTGIVEVDADTETCVVDNAGHRVQSQVAQDGKISFIAENVPSVGYKTYRLLKKKQEQAKTELTVSQHELENAFFKIKLDPASGNIVSIYDKNNKRDVIAGEGNVFETYEDTPHSYDAWNVDADDMSKPQTVNGLESIKVVEQGPVSSSVRVTRNFGKSSIAQDIVIYAKIPRIDFRTKVSWHENHTMLKVRFPFAVNTDYATYEIPYAAIKRTTVPKTDEERAKFEVPAHKWADMSEKNYGVSLLNDCKYGYSAQGNVMRLSLLRSPLEPDPQADRGDHEFTYSIYPHKGKWSDSRTVQMAHELNQPFIARVEKIHSGKLPAMHSFVGISKANVVLGAMKKAEDSDALILRFYESAGKKTKATVYLPYKPTQVSEADLMENETLPMTANGKKLDASFGAYEIKTLKVEF